MSIADPKLMHDGSIWITRGINSGSSADSIPRNQLSFAVNSSLRGDKPSQRPGQKKVALTFESEATQAAFEDGRFQGAGTHIWRSFDQTDKSYLLASISGRIFKIDCQTWDVQDITLAGDANPTDRPTAWFEQGEMFTFIQDGQSNCLIFDGASLRRSNPTQGEIPTGSLMRYALGRMTVVLPDGRSFLAGNLVGSTESGTVAYNFRDSIISFTENDYLIGGGVFSAPKRITALAEVATLDTTLAQGPLQVFTSSGAYSVNYPFDRFEWLTTTYPLVTGSLVSHGALGSDSTVNVNNDVWFRASDGLRSLRVARRDFAGWGDTPLSHEIERILTYDTQDLLSYGSGILFDNRLIMTASPRFVGGRGVVHKALITLDFDEASSIARDGIPAYEGMWTGLNTLKLLALEVGGVERGFAFSLDPNDKIALYELSRNDPADNYGVNGEADQPIPWMIETARFNWGEDSLQRRRYKKLVGGDISASGLSGNVDFTVLYRADSYPRWTEWAGWSECAEQACVSLFCEEPNMAQAREPMRLPDPADVCEAYEGVNNGKGSPKLTRWGFAFQLRIQVTGAARIESLRLTAIDQPEPRYDACRGTEPCLTLQGCNEAIFGYEIT